LYLILVGLAVGGDLADVIDRPLYLVDVPELLSLHYQGNTNDLGGCHDIQEEGLAGLRRGQDQRFGEKRLEVVKRLLCLVRLAEGIRLFLITCTGEPTFPQPGYEAAEGHEASHKPLDILYIPDLP
jgi:hypothetical protein